MSHVDPMVIVWRWSKGHSVIDISRTQSRLCQLHGPFLCVSFAKKLLVMVLGKTGKGFLAWNRQPFSNIIYMIQKHIVAINHITGTTDSWDVIWNVQCYALFTDFSKMKQLQLSLTHVAKPKGTLQSASTASHVSKYQKITILRWFGTMHMLSTWWAFTQYICYHNNNKNRSKKGFREFKVCSDYDHIQPKEEIGYHLTCLWEFQRKL